MPSLMEELEIWFKSRPLWIQDAARRLLEKNELLEEDYSDLLKICGTEAGVEFSNEDIPKPISIPDGALAKEEQSSKIEISAISNVVGINALNPKKPLYIPDGLTVIYGRNGSGKSGYGRILKHVCGAKNPGQLYPNAYNAVPDSQSCQISYKCEGNNCELNWDITQGVNEQLSAIQLYDSACGTVYVTEENQLAYEPPLLRLFSNLTNACDTLSLRLNDLLRELVSSKPIFPNEYGLTTSKKKKKTLTSKITETIIEEKCTWLEEDQLALDNLNVRLKSPDPKASAQKIRNTNIQLDKLLATLRNWSLKLNDDSCSAYISFKKDYHDKQKVASEYAKRIFEDSPLDGIGEAAWSLLWEQARAYSEQVAYPEKVFPNTEENSVCVLCQQPLNNETKIRLSDFDGFVKGELELSAKTAKSKFDKVKESLKSAPGKELINSMIAAAGIEDIMSTRTLSLHENILLNSKNLLKTGIDNEFSAGLDLTVIDDLTALSELREAQAKQLEEDSKKDNRESIQKDALELEARKWLSQQKDAIHAEILLLGKKGKINQAKAFVNTTALTRKKSTLAEQLITEDYIHRFEKEIEKLGVGRINVNLKKTRSDKGKVYFQISLSGNKRSLPVDNILSEGEFRIISIAAFLADVEGHTDNSTFIFDDPISSLDQDYEEKVAERLVELSKTRQVIVFTHRLSLMALLDETLKKEGLQQNIIGLYNEPWGTGEPGPPPIHTQKTEAAINTLISKIPEGTKILEDQGTEPYSWRVKGICSNIRITIEKVIECDLLADVVQRFRRPVTTQGKLHKVAKVASTDCEFIDELMTKYSRYEHSQPNDVPIPMPLPDDLKADLDRLKGWRDGFIQRANN